MKPRAPLEETLVPQIVTALAGQSEPLHHLSVKALLRLDGTVEPAVVWRACMNATDTGLVSRDKRGYFFRTLVPARVP